MMSIETVKGKIEETSQAVKINGSTNELIP